MVDTGLSFGGAAVAPRASPRSGWTVRARSALATTPGRMRVWSVAVVATLVVLGAVSLAAVAHRQAALHTAGDRSEPLIVAAQQIDAALSRADAVAANAFLSGGIEPAALRAQYTSAIGVASDGVADAARRSGTTAEARAALLTLTDQIPVYAGLIETARANNRQGFPIGAAYLRQANHLLTTVLLPAAQQLYAGNLGALARDQRAGRSTTDLASVAGAGAMALVVLGATQLWLRRRTNRLLNPALVVATVLVGGVVLVAVAQLDGEASSLARARDRGFAVVNVVAQGRIAAFGAKGDESLTLIGRGNGTKFELDFGAQSSKASAALAQAAKIATTDLAHAAIAQAVSAQAGYLKVHTQIRSSDDGGHFDDAVKVAVGDGPTSANTAFSLLDTQLQAGLAAGQAEFDQRRAQAVSRLAHLSLGMVLLLLIAGLAVLWGLQQRINEYR